MNNDYEYLKEVSKLTERGTSLETNIREMREGVSTENNVGLSDDFKQYLGTCKSMTCMKE